MQKWCQMITVRAQINSVSVVTIGVTLGALGLDDHSALNVVAVARCAARGPWPERDDGCPDSTQ